jgi:hypothetical protein
MRATSMSGELYMILYSSSRERTSQLQTDETSLGYSNVSGIQRPTSAHRFRLSLTFDYD